MQVLPGLYRSPYGLLSMLDLWLSAYLRNGGSCQAKSVPALKH